VGATLVRAVAAGGSADPNPAKGHGFMYGRSIEDPNGYVWEIMWMDAESAKGVMQHATATSRQLNRSPSAADRASAMTNVLVWVVCRNWN
jgi:hypothetical protein